MNNVETLADLFGSKRALAAACGVDPAIISRLSNGYEGRVPIRYNIHIRAAMRERALKMSLTEATAFVAAVEACLDPAVCPTCHQPLPDGQVV